MFRTSGSMKLTLQGSRPDGTGHASCCTEYVRGREAVMPDLSLLAFIANRNGSFILQYSPKVS